MDYDKTGMPDVYDSGRSYAPHVLNHWIDTISAVVPNQRIDRILDLGCGTARFSSALAEGLDAFVYALDPSERMLEQARKKPHPRVHYLRSSGEHLPLQDRSVDLVFMSMVFHHFDDPVRAAQECYRVLRVGGSVCLRAGSREQIFTYPHVSFFERFRSILETTLHPSDVIVDTFTQAELHLVRHKLVQSETAENWQRFAEKASLRADSVLSQLTDEEFRSGLAKLRSFAQSQSIEEPVVEKIDLFVFRRYK